jgi:hypothetical protein
MYFLLSGEGVTDMGAARGNTEICEGEHFFVGPMAVIVAKIVESKHGYCILDGKCGFVSENRLSRRAKELFRSKKKLVLPGKDRATETAQFYKTARALSRMAHDKSSELKDQVVAVLFRDTDGNASDGKRLWEEKWNSMIDGFDAEEFEGGVPMIPRPKSEAWLICAWKSRPYQACDALEERSGNDRSPNSLKAELATLLTKKIEAEMLSDKVKTDLEINRIKMPSFTAFRKQLEKVIGGSAS